MTIDVDYRFADIEDLPPIDGVERLGVLLLASLLRLDELIASYAFTEDDAYEHLYDVALAVDARAVLMCRMILHKPELYGKISS